MSAPSCLAFYGIRFEVAPHEIKALECRTDPRQEAARKAHLKAYWGNFAEPDERYLLFIGAQLGMLGPEGSDELVLARAELETLFTDTAKKLASTGLTGTPALYLTWEADA